MSHPLEIKLVELNDNELQERISMLYERLRFFYGSGSNMSLVHQLQLFLDEASAEQNRRSERLMTSVDKKKQDNED